jgi:hypothetical protein
MYNYLLDGRRDQRIQSESRHGNTLSTPSLSIGDKMRLCGDHCIGNANINLGTLLDACSEHECMYNGDYEVMYISRVPHSYCSRSEIRICRGRSGDYCNHYSQTTKDG